jgi:hypothetical protein
MPRLRSSEPRTRSPHPIEWNTGNLTGSAFPSSQTIPSENVRGESEPSPGLGSTLPTHEE